ncbi:MAG: PIN domain-containing protein [Bacteroidetes bacterium]|nr:PIN domain-containing protein [Bacteroidota bacterium]
MKVMLDSDVLLDVATRREPFFSKSRNTLNILILSDYHLYVSPVALANVTYFGIKAMKRKNTELFIKLVLRNFSVLELSKYHFEEAISKNYRDLEDGYQIEAAKSANLDFIITRNIKHYDNQGIKIYTPEMFLNIV